MIAGKAAILIVNGGRDPLPGKWLELCLDKLVQHTRWPDHHFYVWNNNSRDAWVDGYVSRIANATLIQADPNGTLGHPHAVPLQRLYERAVSDGAEYVVALDSDAHPIRGGWLTGLIEALDEKTALAGVWRDELAEGIEPYLHASCLCTTVAFIRDNGLRLDVISENTGKRTDTLSAFTDKAHVLGLNIHKLCRSNRNNIHRLISGIYGDTIYHHGAGSRPRVLFWGGGRTEYTAQLNRTVRDRAAALLFEHHDRYIAWLRGSGDATLILGMHRSGTSCLAGCLERSGLHLGDVNRANPHNPRGNHELPPLVQLHESVLGAHGGSWSQPPAPEGMSDDQKRAALDIIAPVLAVRPCGVKEPRMLLLLEDWLKMIQPGQLIGTYRHPSAVARSLIKRDGMTEDEVHRLWLCYNAGLIRQHQATPFPIVSFDIPRAGDYLRTVATAAVAVGLQPDIASLRRFVDDEFRHTVDTQASVPESCREAYEYLERNQYRPGPFEEEVRRLLELSEKATAPVPANMKNVIILGSGRSGTSMVAGTLARAGYFMGDNLWPKRHSNPQGIFEDRDVNHLSERLIASALKRRYRWRPRGLRPRQPASWQRWLAAVPVGTRFRAGRRQTESIRSLTARTPYCFKDPRFCYTLPAWRPHLTNTVFLCVFRDPSTTAESILKECREEAYLRSFSITRDEALRVWHLMYRHVLDIHRHEGTWLFLNYQQVLTGEAFARMESMIGAELDGEFANPKLNRTTPVGTVPEHVQKTYRELCALAGYTP